MGICAASISICAYGLALADESDCYDMQTQTSMAKEALNEYLAYLESDPADVDQDADVPSQPDTEFEVLGHFLDVANIDSNRCDPSTHPAIYAGYYRIDWQYENFQLETASVQNDTAQERTLTSLEADEVAGLWDTGVPKVDTEALSDYALMKATTITHCRMYGIEFRSPETGRIVVAGSENP
ncbi:MAG: hypothetical protein ACYC8W_06185 [Candidatus Tyrphobacter sp.]